MFILEIDASAADLYELGIFEDLITGCSDIIDSR